MRLVEQFSTLTFGNDLALFQHIGAVRDLQRGKYILFNQQDCYAPIG